ncbi:MAG: hypothetical protein GXP16_18055 [Gammaproteobacteria bacterium]|nr:hypothetical protein [Gammaproteobacteria bacterium]
MVEEEVNSPVVRASGIYDVVLLTPFAIPGIAGWVIQKLQVINEFLSLPGAVPMLSPTALLFVNMMACLAIMYSALRIRQPNRLYGGYDVVARILMATLILIYLLIFHIAGVFWGFFAVEVAWAVLQYRAISRKI